MHMLRVGVPGTLLDGPERILDPNEQPIHVHAHRPTPLTQAASSRSRPKRKTRRDVAGRSTGDMTG
ncbi:hypothetical protein BISA_1845 [Bifidobacterium saguini DSM 23967]|uniref:Uncharacterized protein n=1 Tax=Bifidobacterium saguini DSM 23967 TaxID=1437607 RepID=A0A087D6U7_9BIFI|nr:hypothetical protein BISA_1845 [Bifidobacterium saguini DSM 23967]